MSKSGRRGVLFHTLVIDALGALGVTTSGKATRYILVSRPRQDGGVGAVEAPAEDAGRELVILELYDEPLLEALEVGCEIRVTGAREHPRRPNVLRVGKGSNILKVAGPARALVEHRSAMQSLVDKPDEIHRLDCCVVAKDDDVAIATGGEDGGLSHFLRIKGVHACNLAKFGWYCCVIGITKCPGESISGYSFHGGENCS